MYNNTLLQEAYNAGYYRALNETSPYTPIPKNMITQNAQRASGHGGGAGAGEGQGGGQGGGYEDPVSRRIRETHKAAQRRALIRRMQRQRKEAIARRREYDRAHRRFGPPLR